MPRTAPPRSKANQALRGAEPNRAAHTAGLVALLVAITAGVFAPVLRHDFLDWDDRDAVQHNPDFNPPTADSLGHYWTETHLSFFVPVTYTVWWLVANVAGSTGVNGAFTLDPGPFHAVNLCAHLANAVLVFVILRRLIRRDWPAWFGAALFALHPVQVEPVAWVSSMYSSLSGLFALLATWQYLAFSDARFGDERPAVHGSRRTRANVHLAFAAGCYALALLTKPTILLLPLIWLLIDAGLRGRRLRDVALPVGIVFVLLALPIAIVTRAAQPGTAVYSPPSLRPFVATDTLAFYLGKIVWPLHLLPDYGRSPRWLDQHRQVAYLTWIVPAVVLLIGAIVWRTTRWPLIAMLVFLAALAPMLGLAPFDYERYSTAADRYLYFAMLAPAMLLAWGLSKAHARRWATVAATATAAVLCAALAVGSALQLRQWSDSRTLFSYELRGNATSLAAHAVFGFLAAAEHRPDAAIEQYNEALKTNPGDPLVLFNMGNVYLRTGRSADAIACYEQAAKANPTEDKLLSNLGIALAQSNRGAEAVDALNRALALNPRNADAHLNLAIILASGGDAANARQHFQEVIRLHGNVAAAKRGLAFLNAGRY
jgi:Flp pilus assembly protein TadD